MTQNENTDIRLHPAYRLVALDSVTSTMEEARKRAEDGAEDGTLIWAREQTAGRGRMGRTWASPRGNLYFTLILRPDCAPAQAAQLGFIAALSLGEAIGSVAPPLDVTYKWPNDVLLSNRKAAGILLESHALADGHLDYLLLGCGVNVGTFPKDAAFPATSLRYEGTPATVTEVELLEAFSRFFLSWVNRWLEDGFARARTAWLDHAAFRGERIEARLPKETINGILKDLDEDGHLLLELEGGEERRIAAGEIFPPG